MFWSFRGFFCLFFALLSLHLYNSVKKKKKALRYCFPKNLKFLSSIDTSYRKMRDTVESNQTEVGMNKNSKYGYHQ